MSSIAHRFFDKASLELIGVVRGYESDTFSADGSEITSDEVFEIAGRLIHSLIDNDIDGVRLTNLLEEIRE